MLKVMQRELAFLRSAFCAPHRRGSTEIFSQDPGQPSLSPHHTHTYIHTHTHTITAPHIYTHTCTHHKHAHTRTHTHSSNVQLGHLWSLDFGGMSQSLAFPPQSPSLFGGLVWTLGELLGVLSVLKGCAETHCPAHRVPRNLEPRLPRATLGR